MNRRPVLSLRRRPLPAAPGLSVLDAFFVSVLFAVAAATFLQVPLQTFNPFHAEPAPIERPSRIVVWVQAEGGLDVNGQAVARADLEPRLRSLLGLRPDLPVEVVARGAVDARLIAATLDAARRAGAPGVEVTQLDPLASAVSLRADDTTLLAASP